MTLESFENTQEARLTLLSCSLNFRRASITRYTHVKREPILKRTLLVCGKIDQMVDPIDLCLLAMVPSDLILMELFTFIYLA